MKKINTGDDNQSRRNKKIQINVKLASLQVDTWQLWFSAPPIFDLQFYRIYCVNVVLCWFPIHVNVVFYLILFIYVYESQEQSLFTKYIKTENHSCKVPRKNVYFDFEFQMHWNSWLATKLNESQIEEEENCTACMVIRRKEVNFATDLWHATSTKAAN